MAKDKDKNGNGRNGTGSFIKIASFALTVALILTTVILAWSDQNEDSAILKQAVDNHVKVDDARTTDLKDNGTDKCKENELKILLMSKDIEFTADVVDDMQLEQKDIRAEQKAQYENVRKEQQDIRKEQKTQFEEIIKRIDKKHDGP